MNLDALPYTTFIVLVEFCVGTLAVCVLADWRGRVAASFVKLCAAMVACGAVVLMLNALALDPKSVTGGYRLETGVVTWVNLTCGVFLLATLPYNWFVLRERKGESLYGGLVAVAAGGGPVPLSAAPLHRPPLGVP